MTTAVADPSTLVMQDPTKSHPDVKLFNRWSFEEVQVNDISLSDYIGVQPSKHATYVPHTAGRYSVKHFRKAQCPIVVDDAWSKQWEEAYGSQDCEACLTDQNPIQVIVDAIINRRQAVDISPLCRVNQAIYLLTTGARESAFRNIKTIAECLADELINAAKGSSNSYAIKKKDEIERVAKANP
ncbi:ribosomal protein 5B [Hibiscus trionum]|uniref:Ribosomal protein 5B n=1 Tax=Hibiscus trionum TaxID=183268 RepID=A0A9W7J7A4_HIBTR|nr:ribosomal protein 5B [Hibiscus trionum]